MVMLYQNCGQMRSNGGGFDSFSGRDLSQEELITQGKALYSVNCASCHGPIDTSSKVPRSADQIAAAINDYPQMQERLSGLPRENIEAIAAALIFQAEGGGVEINEQGRLEFACTPGTVSKTPFLKLSNREFRSALNQLLDGFAGSLKNDNELGDLYDNLSDDLILDSHYNYIEQSQLVTQLSTLGFFNASFRAAELVSANSGGLNSYPGTNGCLSQNSLSQSCHQNFVRELSSQAYRRPVDAGEAAAIAGRLWDGSLNKRDQIILTFTSIVQDPQFQYKIYNRGVDAPQQANLVALTNHELASRLSFFITGSPPDSQLRSLANSGAIANAATLDAQVDRLLGQSGAQDMIERLFKESYGYDYFENLSYDNDYSNGVQINGLQNAMISELDNFFTRTVLNQDGSFLDIMTSRYANISHAGLRSIYQVGSSGQMTLGAERAGFLNRAAMLTKRSGYRASPIKRGLKVLESALCVNVGSPPPDAPTNLPGADDEILTTRAHAEATSQAPGSSCVFCHSRINPLGFAYEGFDSLGRVRTQERIFDGQGREVASLPVNTQITTEELGLDPVTVSGSTDLANSLGNSDRALLCFAKHLKKFESRAAVNNADNCQMNNSLQRLYGGDQGQGSIKSAIKSLVLSDEFRYWSY